VVLYLHNTSRVDDEPLPNLLQEKGGRGFPYLVMLDADGEVIAPHNGARSVEAFKKTAAASSAFGDLKMRYESGDKKATLGYLLAALDLGAVSVADAKKIYAEVDEKDLDQAKRDEIKAKLWAVEYREILMTVRALDDAIAAGKNFKSMLDAGFKPDGEQHPNVWAMISYYATEEKNAELLAKAIEEFEETAASERFKQANLKRMKDALAEMQKK
jgi:hypothetical protein